MPEPATTTPPVPEPGRTVEELPLTELHRRLGAELGSWPELPGPVPLHYGSLAAEYQALRGGCGVVDRSSAGRLELAGADRLRFANAYLTCDIKSLAPGQGAYGFVTSAQGRILADVVVLAGDDRLWLELPPGRGPAIAEHLRRFLIADRVEIRPLTARLPLSLIGPAAASRLAALLGGSSAAGASPASLASLGSLPQTPWSHVRVSFEGGELTVQRSGLQGEPAWTIWVPAELAEPLVTALLAGGGTQAVGHQALEVWRTERGIPRYGRDFGAGNFPQETGIEEAVSYTKGCYLGQEVVARIHYRGGVQKVLRGLLFAAGTAPVPGTPLLFDGREAGIATTVVESLALRQPVGLSILHRRASEPGSLLQLGGASQGATAEVHELPLVKNGER
ncbi:MAG TPA: hypothetical protein VHR45_12005 [Thermoanaerobaculia bacterium]|nr:hypothetical protein [Thermoanaerobaculia bacterium]